MFTRNAALSWAYVSLSALAACQLPSDKPPEAPTPKPAATSEERDPLPPEERAPEETPPELAPSAEAKPVEPGITPTGAPTRGTLPKDVIDKTLLSAMPAIQACYERELKAQPGLRGNVIMNFVVGPDGKVAHAEPGEPDDALTDTATLDCIVGEIRKLTFPEPKGGRVFINYPIKLEPAKPSTP